MLNNNNQTAEDDIFVDNLNSNNDILKLKRIILMILYIWAKRIIISIIFWLFTLSIMFLIKNEIYDLMISLLIFWITLFIVFLKFGYKNYANIDAKIKNNINNFR